MSKPSFFKKDNVKISYRYYKRSKKTVIFLHGLLSNKSGKKSYFLNNYKSLKISFLKESKPLGTAGALSLIKNRVTNNFIVLNGDSIFDVNLNEIANVRLKKHQSFMALTNNTNYIVGLQDLPYNTGITSIGDCVANLKCKLVNKIKKGDHVIFICEVVDVKHNDKLKPLSYFNSKYN